MKTLVSSKERKHRGRMWDHIKDIGEGQVQVQAGTGQVEAAGESRGRRQVNEQDLVGETPEGGMESSGGEQTSEQGPKWRAEVRQHGYRNNFQKSII